MIKNDDKNNHYDEHFDSFKEIVSTKDLLRVRIMLKDKTILYKNDSNKFMKFLKYAEDNLDNLYRQNNVENIGIATTKDEFNKNSEKIVHNFTKKSFESV